MTSREITQEPSRSGPEFKLGTTYPGVNPHDVMAFDLEVWTIPLALYPVDLTDPAGAEPIANSSIEFVVARGEVAWFLIWNLQLYSPGLSDSAGRILFGVVM